jgi:hypothetical protein
MTKNMMAVMQRRQSHLPHPAPDNFVIAVFMHIVRTQESAHVQKQFFKASS